MSDRPTPETDAHQNVAGMAHDWLWRDFARKLERQRDALLEVMEMVYAMKPGITECRLHGTIWEDIGKAIANVKGEPKP